MSRFGKITERAADLASSTVGELLGSGTFPESDYALASLLFQQIVQAEKGEAERDRAYYLDLMRQCLETVREGR